jgi:molybdate transport system regulatory protein
MVLGEINKHAFIIFKFGSTLSYRKSAGNYQAMNRLKGTIVKAQSNGHIWRVAVRVGDTEMSAVLLDFAKSESTPLTGKSVIVSFKEAETALALEAPLHTLSIRNRLPCRVLSVEDDGILANVNLDHEGHTLRALITSESVKDLGVVPGKSVNALIKSTEVMIDLEGL